MIMTIPYFKYHRGPQHILLASKLPYQTIAPTGLIADLGLGLTHLASHYAKTSKRRSGRWDCVACTRVVYLPLPTRFPTS
jgi:hypothetical protein